MKTNTKKKTLRAWLTSDRLAALEKGVCLDGLLPPSKLRTKGEILKQRQAVAELIKASLRTISES